MNLDIQCKKDPDVWVVFLLINSRNYKCNPQKKVWYQDQNNSLFLSICINQSIHRKLCTAVGNAF